MIDSSIIGVYLAAGRSSRMGTNKLELPVGETYLGSLAFKAALESKLDWTIVITRKEDPLQWLMPFSRRNGWSMLQCPDAEKGQSASLKAGINAAKSLGAKAIVVLLADQPFVSSRIINLLLDKYQEPFLASSQNGVLMPPIIISQQLFPDLMMLSGDKGARELLRFKRKLGTALELDGSVFTDIDTVEDYYHLLIAGRNEIGCNREECDPQRCT